LLCVFRKMCFEKYGVAPEVKVTGHTATVFPYIVSPLDYILHEILKNSMRYCMICECLWLAFNMQSTKLNWTVSVRWFIWSSFRRVVLHRWHTKTTINCHVFGPWMVEPFSHFSCFFCPTPLRLGGNLWMWI